MSVLVVDAGTSTGIGAALDDLEAACRSEQGFAVLIDARGTAGEAPVQHRQGQMRRLRALRADMKQRCVGLAFLTSPEALAAQSRRVRAARLMFGCPVEAFGALDDARNWLTTRGATLRGGLER